MRILVSAYACEPDAGSELGKGWNIALELARQGHDVTVLTCGSHHRLAIERHCDKRQVPSSAELCLARCSRLAWSWI